MTEQQDLTPLLIKGDLQRKIMSLLLVSEIIFQKVFFFFFYLEIPETSTPVIKMIISESEINLKVIWFNWGECFLFSFGVLSWFFVCGCFFFKKLPGWYVEAKTSLSIDEYSLNSTIQKAVHITIAPPIRINNKMARKVDLKKIKANI